MGLFTRKAKLPKGKVESWSREDVRKWVKFINMSKYKEDFKLVTGKRLLAMTNTELVDLTLNKTDAEVFAVHLAELRERDGVPAPVEPVKASVAAVAAAAPAVEPVAVQPVQQQAEQEATQTEEPAAAVESDIEVSDSAEEPVQEQVEAPVSPVEPEIVAPAAPEFQTPVSPGSENVSFASKEVQGSAQKPAELEELAAQSADDGAITPSEEGVEGSNGGALKWVKKVFSKKGGEGDVEEVDYPEEPTTDVRVDDIEVHSNSGTPSYGRNAEYMSKWAGGAARLHELTAYFDQLNIGGHGLVTAAETTPIVGMIVGALWDLHDGCAQARGNRANCAQLDAFGQDVLRVFDFKGKRVSNVDTPKLQSLFDLVCEAVRIVGNCSRPGWLLRMACDERSVEDFTMIHNTILETLRSEGMDQLGNQRRLDYGSYTDASKPLRRKLKQLGQGSVEGGLRAIKSNEAALKEICNLISVDPMDVVKELEGVNSELDDLATIYTKTVEGNAVEEQLYIRECEDIFDTYDRQRTGTLTFDELRAVLGDLGFIDGMAASEADAYVMQRFHLSSTTSTINFENFCQFYKRIKMSRARHELRTTLGVQSEYDLKKTFISFASFGTRQMLEEMDSARFMKLCKDCKLLSRTMTTSDVDLVFVKVKAKGARKINFEQFVQALAMISEKKNKPLDEVVQSVLKARGPANTGTKADYVKFHDDKSTYTGVYARGGPSTIDANKDLSAYLDRSEADVRGVKKSDLGTPMRNSVAFPLSHALVSPIVTTPGSATPRGMPGSARYAREKVYSPVPLTARTTEFSDLESVFRAFATFGAGPTNSKHVEMDGLRFAKLCRDCDLMDGRLNSTTVDLIFTKVKAKGARKVSFREFKEALELIAEQKGMTPSAVAEQVRSSRGPVLVGTKADSVRFYDDRASIPGTPGSLRGSLRGF